MRYAKRTAPPAEAPVVDPSLPHSLESEESVVGGILVHSRKLVDVKPILDAHDFWHPTLCAIYEAQLELDADGAPVDAVTVLEKMRALETFNKLSAFNGADYLTELMGKVVTVENLGYHARIVARKATARRELEAVSGLHQALLDGDEERAGLYERRLDEARARHVASVAANQPPAWHSRLVSVGDDWYTKQPPLRDWFLRDARTTEQRGWMPQGKAGLLIAAGGVGKTMALMQMAIGAAKGSAWLGTFAFEKPVKVFALLAEEEAAEAQRRAFGAHGGLGAPPAPGMIEILPMAGQECALLMRDERGGAVETPFAIQLRDRLAATGPWGLIILEPISRVGGPDVENETAAATRCVQFFESIAEATGATVLGAHHTNKIGRNGGSVDANASRGASALTDGFRWVASLNARKTEALGEVVTLEVVKSNYSFKGDPLLLRRDDGGRLEPMNGEQMAAVSAEASGEEDRKRKTAQREEERKRTLDQRAADDAERKARQAAAREEERKRKDAADLQSVRDLIAANPSLAGRALRDAVKVTLRCGSDRASAAILAAEQES